MEEIWNRRFLCHGTPRFMPQKRGQARRLAQSDRELIDGEAVRQGLPEDHIDRLRFPAEHPRNRTGDSNLDGDLRRPTNRRTTYMARLLKDRGPRSRHSARLGLSRLGTALGDPEETRRRGLANGLRAPGRTAVVDGPPNGRPWTLGRPRGQTRQIR